MSADQTVVLTRADDALHLTVTTIEHDDTNASARDVIRRLTGEAEALHDALTESVPAATMDALYAFMAAARVGRHHARPTAPARPVGGWSLGIGPGGVDILPVHTDGGR